MRWPLPLAPPVALLLSFGTHASPTEATEATEADEPRELLVVDQVVAVVDQEPILLSEVAKRAEPLVAHARAQAKSKAAADQVRPRVYREALDTMIDERLVAHHAIEQGIRVDKSETDRALESVAHQNQMTPTELLAEVEKQMNMTAEEYVAALAQQIVMWKAVRREIENVPADDDEMSALMARTQKTLLKRLRQKRFWSLRVRFR